MNKVDELKEKVREHLKRELEIAREIVALSQKELEEYKEWFYENPTVKKALKVSELLEKGDSEKVLDEIYD